MKSMIITLLLVSSWITNVWLNNTLTSDTLRRYGIDSHIMKTSGFKKARRFNRATTKTKNKKHKKQIRE